MTKKKPKIIRRFIEPTNVSIRDLNEIAELATNIMVIGKLADNLDIQVDAEKILEILSYHESWKWVRFQLDDPESPFQLAFLKSRRAS